MVTASCLDESDEMELTITLAPLAYAGPDAEICETDTFNLVDATASNYAIPALDNFRGWHLQ